MPDDSVLDPAFFDTNILLYLFDRGSNEKRHIAEKLFNKHQQDGSLRLSLQAVHEFAANLLSKKFGVPPATVTDVVRDLLALEVTAARAEDTLTALQYVDELGVNFWDALILAVEKREGCGVLYSEDFQHGRIYDTVKIVNPFKEYS